MNTFNGGCRQQAAGWLTSTPLLAALAAVMIHFMPGVTHLLEYERHAVAAGEIWRHVTCHLTHWSGNHLFWDVLMFVALGVMCDRLNRRRTLACLGASAVLLPVMIWWVQPEWVTYRGLSGVDSALFSLLVMLLFRETTPSRGTGLVVIAVAAGFGFKICYEMLTGDTMFVNSRGMFVPVPLAHALGAAVGIVTGVAWGPTRHLAS